MVNIKSCLLVCALFSYGVHSQSIVSTNVGKIIGLEKSIDIDGQQKTVTQFLGIPYAEDTSGQNRFKKPIPKAPFSDTFQAFNISPICVQPIDDEQGFTSNKSTEDCLSLNIYVPRQVRQPTSTQMLPVMIWIHGGGYVNGAANSYQFDTLSAFGDVIVVTVNYRVDIFGFLNVGDSRAKGNQGLWDQQLAIKWVNNNIRAFMGDPDEVTIFGESAGAGSVILQSMYAGNKGLFKRVIAESGSALGYWSYSTKPNADDLIKFSGCDSGPLDPIECLRGKSASELEAVIYKQDYINAVPLDTVHCPPAVDDEFLVEDPYAIVFGNSSISAAAREMFNSVDILIGVNNCDGGFFVNIWKQMSDPNDMKNLTALENDFQNYIIPHVISTAVRGPSSIHSNQALKKAFIFEYTNWARPNNENTFREMVLQLASETLFFTAAIETIKAHALEQRGKTFFYVFSADAPGSPIDWLHCAYHAEEIQYMMGASYLTDADKTLSRGMMTAWSNFAKSRQVAFRVRNIHIHMGLFASKSSLARCYKTFLVLNSTEHKLYHAHKC